MKVIQRSGGRSIRIEDGKVTVNSKKVSPEEGLRIKQEGLAKLEKVMRVAKPSPSQGDSVVVVNATGVHVSGKGVMIRRK